MGETVEHQLLWILHKYLFFFEQELIIFLIK